MIRALRMCPHIEKMLGIASYPNRKICSITGGYGIKPYFPPKTNVTFRAKSVESWKNKLYSFMGNARMAGRIPHVINSTCTTQAVQLPEV